MLAPQIRFAWIEDGDHSFTPRKASARGEDDNLRDAITAVVEFVTGLERRGRQCCVRLSLSQRCCSAFW